MIAKKVDTELSSQRTQEGQKYRENLLNGRNVLAVTCGFDSSKKNIYDKLYSLGVNLFLLEDGRNEFAQEINKCGYLKAFVDVDMTMRDCIVDECITAVDRSLNAQGVKKLDGVLTFWDDAVGLTARLATHYNVKTNSIVSVDTAHDKYLTRRALEQAGQPTPLCFRVSNVEELKKVADKMHYPAILKPVQGAASIGVSMVSSGEDAIATFKSSIELMETILSSKQLMGLCWDEGTDSKTTFVLEEFIDGEEVDVDICLDSGEDVYSNINLDWPDETGGGRFIEWGITFPALCNGNEKGREFRNAAKACARALGLSDGVCHIEMKYSSRYGPMLIECNPRMGGGPLYAFHKQCFGVDLVVEHTLIMCGYPSRPIAYDEPEYYCSSVFLYAEKDGILTRDVKDIEEDLTALKHVYEAKICVKKGDEVRSWAFKAANPSFLGRIDFKVHKDELSYDEGMTYCKAVRGNAINSISDLTAT